jgi:hypothetical protein
MKKTVIYSLYSELLVIADWFFNQLKLIADYYFFKLKQKNKLLIRYFNEKIVISGKVENNEIFEERYFLSDVDVPSSVINIENKKMDVLLDVNLVFIEEVTIPKTKRTYLDSIVRLHLEMKFPLPLSCVTYSFNCVAQDDDLMLVSIVVVKNSTIVEIEKRLGAINVALGDILFSSSEGLIYRLKIHDSLVSLVRTHKNLLRSILFVVFFGVAMLLVNSLLERYFYSGEIKSLNQDLYELNSLYKKYETLSPSTDLMSALSSSMDATDVLMLVNSSIRSPSWVSDLAISSEDDGFEITATAHTADIAIFLSDLKESTYIRNIKISSSESDSVNVDFQKIRFNAEIQPDHQKE